MSSMKTFQPQRQSCLSGARPNRRCLAPFKPLTRAAPLARCCVDVDGAERPSFNRRNALLISLASATLSPCLPAAADDADFTTLYGTASPPTSYGGYGGNAKESAKYSFDYPSTWKPETIGKVQKGMQGMDAKVTNPRSKSQTAYVITFGRAGEDNKNFKLGDVDTTLAGFAGADYDLQDALTGATDKLTTTREVNGQKFYDYEVLGPDIDYLATVTLSGGKVFAMFIKSPSKAFKADESKLRTMLESFKTL